MLTVTIPTMEFYDEAREEFITIKEYDLVLEHSLVSLSKWESKWCKPFLSAKNKSKEEVFDYIRCMTINQLNHPVAYNLIPKSILDKISNYIESPMTATTFPIQPKSASREIITSELIYYWMVSFNIPFECQKWHLNRLLTLINVCNIKNQPKKKLSHKEWAKRQHALNEARKKQLKTTG